MDKILFIVPPNISYDNFVNPPNNVKSAANKSGIFGSIITDMPLGVISLSAYVKKFALAETKLIDFNIELNKLENFEFSSFKDFFSDCLKKQAEFNPTIIAISVLFTPSYQSMLDIAGCCRKIFNKAIIIAGGGVPTNMFKEIFRDSECFDAFCYGEGEKPMLKLLKAEDKFRHLEENFSWITRKKVEGDQAFKYDFIENLDEIPFFDYDMLDIKTYELNPTIHSYLSIEKKKSFPVMTSRGCPHRCCFCAAYTIRGRAMRYYSVERIGEDLKRLKEQYGAEIIIFQDDHFMADRRRFFEIINILKYLKLKAFFPNSLALYALDRKVLEALKEIGVNQLVLSVESGSEKVLREIMHKPLNLSIVRQVVDNCRDLGIYSDINILIGFPGETKQDIEDGKEFLKTTYANWFRVNMATPLVGSELLEICLKNNYIKGNYLDCNFKKAIVETQEFTAEYIQEKAYQLNLELNFAYNSDFRLGKYETALRGFENAIKAKNDHALAYYFAAKCYERLNNSQKAEEYMNMAKKNAENPFWRKYADMFNIPNNL